MNSNSNSNYTSNVNSNANSAATSARNSTKEHDESPRRKYDALSYGYKNAKTSDKSDGHSVSTGRYSSASSEPIGKP